jgi:raffinose/stachyose/melibiose transport system substrate-binding protein
MLNDFLRRMTPLTRSTAGAALALAIGAAASGSAHAQALVTWDDYTFAAQSAVIEQLNKNFEAAHPGVTVQRTARTFDDLSMTLKLAVSAGNGPVVTKVNQGAGDMGAMVKENLLVPLDPYIAKFGWDKRQSDSVLARDRWSDKGEFGVGKTYGISGLGEMVGLYYNLKVLTDAGLKAPTSFEDFLSELDALKAKGIARSCWAPPRVTWRCT